MSTHKIAVIPGDGIGNEVVPAAVDCLERIAELHSLDLEFTYFDWGSEYYARHGRMMAEDGLEQLAKHHAIFLGAVGSPDVPDTESLWGLLIPIRREFQQYINLRPVKTLDGVASPLAAKHPIDLLIVRENNEGEYSEVGGRMYRGQPEESAMQTTVFTRLGVLRAAHYAARLAASRRGHLTSATKSNGIVHTMPFWDEVVGETVREYPDVTLTSELVDALAAHLVLKPWTLDVIVASNLFGDILSDLGSAATGSIGLAPSANLNPEGDFPSLFEPVHGSAPDIAGKGLANPVGQIWSGAMMLEHLGHPEAAAHLQAAFESALRNGFGTRDVGGTSSTSEFTAAVVAAIDALAAVYADSAAATPTG
ncbi:tartrate dehydrogenase/decarboxylase/D-malate dehydrogenase [Arthrobacter globiformis]|uniref:tartrate dehydrogenase n=1 Tax=Arthrobacter globiformis TaxID=1665 RepID=UPI00277E4CE0|nr:tartrate dehydrogenase [Arthrobacter globiformis]MDQ1058573.1 tartrate dehydrogenase/decarboxylase/D-malate dehydrogenase [Arthrobacter globiformis]